MVANNRITELLGDIPPIPRSPAQQQASRQNGQQSRGPVTEAGKAISRANAVTHGLFARMLTPAADARQNDVLFRKARASLVVELQPTRFTQLLLIDALASDFIQLGRARAMLELLQRPAGLAGKDAAEWQQRREMVQELKGLDRWLADPLGQKDDGSLLERLASIVSGAVKGVREYLEVPPEDVVPEEELDPFEREELKGMQKLWRRIQPFAVRLANPADVAGLLAGQIRPATGEMAVARDLVHRHRIRLVQRIKEARPIRARATALADAKLLQLANEPEKLLLLQRYLLGLERGIERKLRQFEGA